MRHKKDSPDPSFGGIVFVMVALVTITLILRSALVGTHPAASATTRPGESISTVHRGSGSVDRALERTSRAPDRLAPAPAPLAKLVRHCSPVFRTGQITAVSYNIHSALGSGGLQLARIAQSISLWNADVVMLQEVDVNRAWTQHINMPQWLASQLGWHYAFGPNVVRGHGSLYGTAILSRYPIVTETNQLLPNRPGMQQRGLLHAVIAPHGREISLYDTHLENRSQPMRMQEIRALDPVVAADPRPLLLGGDFNSTPGSPVIAVARQALSDTWTDVGAGAGLTHPSWHLQGRIDYLFHRGAITPVQADVVNGGFSDHMAVRATYEYRYRHGVVCHLSAH